MQNRVTCRPTTVATDTTTARLNESDHPSSRTDRELTDRGAAHHGTATPLPSNRSLTYTESATAGFEQIIRHAALDGSKVMVPAFFPRNVFEKIFEHHDLEPVFVDIDEDTYHIDIDHAAHHIDDVDAVLLLHTFGLPAPLDRWADLAREADVVLIEDCARALGARYQGRPVGSFGRYAFFSMVKSTPLSFGGILASASTDIAVDLEAPRIDADRILRTLYSVVPWKVPFETEIARVYDRVLVDGESTAPEIGQIEPPTVDAVRRIDPINRWLFERYFQREFTQSMNRYANVAAELRDVLSRQGFDVQADTPGRVAYVLPATVPGDRDTLVSHLESRGHPVAVIWRDPWGLTHERGRDRSRFPETRRVADQIVTFRVREMSMADVRQLERDLEEF